MKTAKRKKTVAPTTASLTSDQSEQILKTESTYSGPSLALVVQPGEFFKEQVNTALTNQKIKIDENTEHYLVTLLSKFMVTDNLFSTKEDGAKQEEVLAILLHQASVAADAETQQRVLRRLGDISLYTAGYFGERLSRKIVDVDYYIGMGQNAYSSLAKLNVHGLMRGVFTQLSKGFPKFVDVLAEVSERAMPQTEKNLLRLYETWLKTRSERAEKSLKEAGIIPNASIKTDVN